LYKGNKKWIFVNCILLIKWQGYERRRITIMKLKAEEAARQFIEKHFPDCDAALLAGSVIRQEATSTSDLDIVIFDNKLPSAYRESVFAFGWPIEVFVHNFQSYKDFFDHDVKRARPSLPRMVSEGTIIKNNMVLKSIKEEAAWIIEKGPKTWSEKEIELKRYFITDTLDDFIGSAIRAEELFIASTLAELLHEFVLRTNNRWIGNSKWIVRELYRYDQMFAERFVHAFDLYYKTGEKKKVIELADIVLQPFGGRLFDGFSIRS
jgi:predicted nucleotidyltransferase